MKSNQIRWTVALVVAAVAYSVVAFLIPTEKNGLFFLSYAFTVIAFAAQFYVFYVAAKGDGSVRSRFYGFPIIRIGVIYLAVQVVLSFLFIVLAGVAPVWIAVILYVVLLGGTAIGLIAADTMRDEVVRQDVKLAKNVSAMRAMQSKADSLVSMTKDEDAARELKQLADELKYSDPVSSDALREIESDISSYLDELQNALLENDSSSIASLCQKTRGTLAERNRLCKLGKA